MYLCELCLVFSICSVHMALEQTASLTLQKHQGQKRIDGEQTFHCIAIGPYMTDYFVFSQGQRLVYLKALACPDLSFVLFIMFSQ